MSNPQESDPSASSIDTRAAAGSRRTWILIGAAGLIFVVGIVVGLAVASIGQSRRLVTNSSSGPSAVVGSASSPVAIVLPVLATATAPAVIVPTAIPTDVPTPTLIPPPTPTVTGAYPLPSATIPPVPTAVAAVACTIAPVRGFAVFYNDRPSVAAQLGCALAPEIPATAIVQQYDRGELVRLSDQAAVAALTNDGKWAKYSLSPAAVATTGGQAGGAFASFLKEQPSVQSALGSPTSPDRSLGAAVQEFDRGTLLWTADQVIVALYANGAWEQRPDTFRDPTATPGAASPVTAAATGSPTSGAAVSASCPIQPVRGFGLAYRQSVGVGTRLGCAQSPETAVDVDRQVFDNGTMLRLAGAGNFLVLQKNGRFGTSPDPWQAGQALSDVGAPPPGHVVPDGAIGAAWRQLGGPTSPLGWPVAIGAHLAGAQETFAGGRMIWTADKVIFVLFSDGTYQSIADTFVDSTPSPAASGG